MNLVNSYRKSGHFMSVWTSYSTSGTASKYLWDSICIYGHPTIPLTATDIYPGAEWGQKTVPGKSVYGGHTHNNYCRLIPFFFHRKRLKHSVIFRYNFAIFLIFFFFFFFIFKYKVRTTYDRLVEHGEDSNTLQFSVFLIEN